MAKKILVVDDEIETLKLVGLMLEGREYEIMAAATGAQALERARGEKADLVILDIMMPDMDGYEVCRRLRADATTAGLPIIMLTAQTMVTAKVAGFQAGADDYLAKPVRPGELAARVEALLLRSEWRQTKEQPPPARAKVIGFLGSKGGVGTTTLAVNIAVALAQQPAKDQRVLLADMQSGTATSGIQLGLQEHRGIARLLDESADRLEAGTVEAQLQEYMPGVQVLTGQFGPSGMTAPLLPDHAEVIVHRLAAMADYVLLDLGTGLEEVNRRVLPSCDYVVVTIEPHRLSLTLAQALIEEMTASLNISAHRIIVVLVNRAPSSSTFSKKVIEDQLHHDLAVVVTPAPELAFQAGEQRKPMVLAQPTSVVAQQIRTLAEHLVHL